MQKYLSPAKRYISRVIPHPADIKGFVRSRRALVYGMSAAVLLVTMLSLVVIRGNMNTNHDAYTHEINAKGNSVTTITNGNTMQISDGMNASDGKTSVIVNDQQINVPQNGSVSKTITNEDGSKTHINVSHSSNSTGDSTYSSSSTSTNISTNTYSNNVNLHSP